MYKFLQRIGSSRAGRFGLLLRRSQTPAASWALNEAELVSKASAARGALCWYGLLMLLIRTWLAAAQRRKARAFDSAAIERSRTCSVTAVRLAVADSLGEPEHRLSCCFYNLTPGWASMLPPPPPAALAQSREW